VTAVTGAESVTGPGPTARVAVAVVVVAYNSADVLPGLIASLPEAMGDLAWQLVVADNASTDDSVAVVRRLAPEAVVVASERNAGYASGINSAVAAAAPHESVLVLNPDVRLEARCVRELLRVLAEPGAGIAVPRLADAQGRLIASLRREPSVLNSLAATFLGADRADRWAGLGEVVTDPASYEGSCTTDWAEGSVQLVSAECWRDVGSWDESFFLYSEETDFHLRAGAAGHAVRYVPAARATHLEGESAGSVRLWPMLVVNRVRLHRRRHGWLRAVPFWAAVLLHEATRAALGRKTSRAAVRDLVNPWRMRAPAGPEWLR
jgi:N-acetylglucosaminyl-diphospho-decaprenol L-rhamnosyltransferase